MTDSDSEATWTASQWLGKTLIDRDGERIGKLQDVYVDVETDEPQFATVKEGFLGRHLTFVPLAGVEVDRRLLDVAAVRRLLVRPRQRSRKMK